MRAYKATTMTTPSEFSRIHWCFVGLAVYWGTISIALIILNPIGDLLDTFEGDSPSHKPIVGELGVIDWWLPPPLSSLQFLVGSGAPIIAFCVGLRHRWAVYVGTIASVLYLLFTFYALLFASERADIRPWERPSECYATGISRISGSVLWIVAAVPLLWHLERRRRTRDQIDLSFYERNSTYVYQGRETNARLVMLFNFGFLGLGLATCAAGLVCLGTPPFSLVMEGMQKAADNIVVVVAGSGIFAVLGATMIAVGVGCFRQKTWAVYLGLSLSYLIAALLLVLYRFGFEWSLRNLFREAEAVPFWISLGVAAYCHWLLFLVGRIKRAGLPPNIRLSHLTKVDRAESGNL